LSGKTFLGESILVYINSGLFKTNIGFSLLDLRHQQSLFLITSQLESYFLGLIKIDFV
jgi:hypothetical protein